MRLSKGDWARYWINGWKRARLLSSRWWMLPSSKGPVSYSIFFIKMKQLVPSFVFQWMDFLLSSGKLDSELDTLSEVNSIIIINWPLPPAQAWPITYSTGWIKKTSRIVYGTRCNRRFYYDFPRIPRPISSILNPFLFFDCFHCSLTLSLLLSFSLSHRANLTLCAVLGRLPSFSFHSTTWHFSSSSFHTPLLLAAQLGILLSSHTDQTNKKTISKAWVSLDNLENGRMATGLGVLLDLPTGSFFSYLLRIPVDNRIIIIREGPFRPSTSINGCRIPAARGSKEEFLSFFSFKQERRWAKNSLNLSSNVQLPIIRGQSPISFILLRMKLLDKGKKNLFIWSLKPHHVFLQVQAAKITGQTRDFPRGLL